MCRTLRKEDGCKEEGEEMIDILNSYHLIEQPNFYSKRMKVGRF